MTNQIQMIKCLNDSVKDPNQRSGLLCRPKGRLDSLQKAVFLLKTAFQVKNDFPMESQSRLNLGTPRSNPFDHSVWPLGLVHGTRYSSF